ncbi:mucin-5AC-like [Vanessa cardui]|uniref:mucin-5AC-like n=1 Tax=Vanessa cardui TaxID=171605 RepID=UPI001F1409E9|nr:mucin-5AC-like [Vanessa cardui]
MFLIYLAAFIAACGAAKLDRTYLPPPSAAHAGGSPGSLQVPLTRAIDQASQNIPAGSFVNEHQGVVVEAAIAGTRASSQQSGLGGSRDTYGSTDSKVGDAAFRTTSNQQPNHNSNFGSGHSEEPDLSAFYQPSHSFKPGNVQIIRDYVSDTIKYHNDIDLNKFNYGFETNNGIKASESGVATNGVQAQGGYSYTGDDGRVYSVSYTADEHGFRAQGSHLPTPPPIPLAILKSLEQNARDEAAGIIDDGSYDAKKYNEGGYYTKSKANGEYNDRQSNKFGERPGSSDGSGTFINQNQQAFGTSNFNGQFGFIHDSSKDKFNSEPFKYSGAHQFNNMNDRNTVPKIEHNNQFFYNGFGSRNEYLPPNRGQFDSTFFIGGNKDSFSIPQTNLQQNLQGQGQFGKPQFNNMRPNTFDLSPGIISQPAFNSHINSFPSNSFNSQGSMSSFSNDKNVSPSTSSQSHNKPESNAANNFMNQNPIITQQSMIASNDNKPIFTQDSFSQSFASVSSFPSQTQSGSLPTTQLSTASGSFNPNVNTIVQPQYTKVPGSSFDKTFSSVVPTVQPQFILSPPFETPKISEPSTLLNSGKTELLNASNVLFGAFNPSINTVGQPQYTHIPIAGYDTSLSSVIPTLQPQIIQTTAFEAPKTKEPATLLDSGKTELLNTPTISSGSFNPSVNTFGQTQYTQVPIASYDTSLSSVIPTVQPQITLTTPFENPKIREPTTIFDFRNMEFSNATTIPDLTVTNQNIRLPTTQLNTAPSGTFNPNSNIIEQAHTHIPISNVDPSFPSAISISQPQITLTTPYEAPKTGEPATVADFGKTESQKTTTVQDFTVTDSQSSKISGLTSSNNQQFPTQPTLTISGNNFSGLSTSSFDTSPQSTSQSFDNTQTTQFSENSTPQVTQAIFVPNRQSETEASKITQAPTTGQSNNFNGQTQAADHSYIYNTPSIAFNTPSIQSNTFPSGMPSLQFDKVTQSLTPQDSTSTTQYQTQSTFNNSPIPTTMLSYTTLPENELKESTLQASIGITQASLSPFPSIVSTDSSNFKESLPQSELSTPSQSSLPQTSTTSVTETAEVLSTFSDNRIGYTDSQLLVKDKMNEDINKMSTVQYTNELYQYDKPAQELPSQTEKEGGELNIKTERPQLAVSTSQFSQEGSTLPMDQNTIQGESETSQTILDRFNQHDIPNPTEHTVQLSTQPANLPSTMAQQDLSSNEYTTSQFQQHTSPAIAISNYKPSTLFPSTVPSNTEKLSDQTSTTLSDNPTIGLQSTTQLDGFSIKETTSSHFQQTNQQTETQFNYQPSTSIPAVQTTPEINEQTQFASISQILGTQSTAQFNQESYTNKATTLPQFQQTVTQFAYKPSTLIPAVDQSTFDGFNTQNQDKQYTLSTSFVQPTATDEPTQSGTQAFEGSIDKKQTTMSHFQTPSHEISTTFSQPSTFIPSTTQTETPAGTTQFGEVYDYKKPTEGLITPQNENNGQLSTVSQQFATQSNMDHQTMTITEKEINMQETQQPQFNTQPSTQYNQEVTEKVTMQFHLAQSEAVTGAEYNTGSTIIPSSPQLQMTSNTQVPDQTSTVGEVYEYTKPAQGLPQQTQDESEHFDQKIQMQLIEKLTTIPAESAFETKQTTISQSTEAPISTSATFQTQSSLNSQTTNSLTSQPELTQETLAETIPSASPPQFSFYSACCQGIKTEKNQITTSANEVQESELNPSTQNMDQVTEKNVIEEKQNLNLSALQEPQKGSQTYAGIGEDFGGPRKPPSFDETGYHY